MWIAFQECVDEEVDQAVRLSEIVSPGREVAQIKEGEEEEEFWEAIGGKTGYNTSDDISKPILLPRFPSYLSNPVLITKFEGYFMLLLGHMESSGLLKYLILSKR